MERAAALGYGALAITDECSLAGVVRAHVEARAQGLHLVVGSEIRLVQPGSGEPHARLVLLAQTRRGYGNLSHWITVARRRAAKGTYLAHPGDLEGKVPNAPMLAGLPECIALLVPAVSQGFEEVFAHAMWLKTWFGADRAAIALELLHRTGDEELLERVLRVAQFTGLRIAAAGDVLMHVRSRKPLQDTLSATRIGKPVAECGYALEPNAEQHLRARGRLAALYAPEWLENTMAIAAQCSFSLGELKYEYPQEIVPVGETPASWLRRLVEEGVPKRFPDGLSVEYAKTIESELAVIAELQYEAYFLTVADIVRWARAQGILCQGRGSAANSAVCWVLGVTSIDPVQSNLLFERFLSAERKEPPDIDVDFEHERREEVIQWVYETYGRTRAALCATVMRFRARGAVRDVGKVLGLTEDVTGALASQVWGWSEEGVTEDHAGALNLNLDDRRLRLTLDLAQDLIGFPRQLGTHPGGFVLTRDALSDLVPVLPAAMAGRQIIEWDKNDIDLLHFMKVDVLGLGMLGCMRRSFDLLALHRPGGPSDLADIPQEDPATYAMIRRADTLGTFQIESRAQMAMLPRLQPRTLYDLVIQVAIVRPGPIQGDMVHPYLRRREGLEQPEYPQPELRRVLEKTLGVPLFQEQAMQVAIHCAGFTPGEADQLRRAMATFKQTGGVSPFKNKLIQGMTARGYSAEFAQKTFSQIEGFGSYGFPESHAASFALVAYTSSWMKCHHPDVFCAALLNSQPMGFYAPAQVVRDAREHGVPVRPVDVNHSRWDCTLEDAGGTVLAVRLGLRLVKGLAGEDGVRLVLAQGEHRYDDLDELWRRAGVPVVALERLAEADAFGSLGLDRRAALWAIRGLSDAPLPLFAAADNRPEVVEPPVVLDPMRPGREVVEDYGSTGLTLRAHPVEFLRAELRRRGMVACGDLAAMHDGRRVVVPGVVLVRQKPGSAKGIMFITTEDETGVANLILWPSLFARQRRLVLSASMIACHGRVQTEAGVTHVIADRLEDLSELLRSVGELDGPWPLQHGRGDGATHPGASDRGELVPRVRDVYVPDTAGIRVATRDFR